MSSSHKDDSNNSLYYMKEWLRNEDVISKSNYDGITARQLYNYSGMWDISSISGEAVKDQIGKLDTITKDEIAYSEKVYKEMRATHLNFSVHDAKIHILQGKSIIEGLMTDQKRRFSEAYSVLEDYRKMEDFFISRGSVTKRPVFVFRGLRLEDLNQMNNDPDTVTFVTWDINKALNFFKPSSGTSDVSKNGVGVMMVIELPIGSPIIRTHDAPGVHTRDFYNRPIYVPTENELVLRHSSVFYDPRVEELSIDDHNIDGYFKVYRSSHPLPRIFDLHSELPEVLKQEAYSYMQERKGQNIIMHLKCKYKKLKRKDSYRRP